MRIVYVLRTVGYVSYHASTLRELGARGHRITLVFDQETSEGSAGRALQALRAELSHLQTAWLVRRQDGWRPWLRLSRELRSVAGYVARKGQSPFYEARWRSYLPRPVRILAQWPPTRALLASGLSRRWLAGFERLAPPSPQAVEFLRKLKPDVVVASPANMRYSEELEYIKAAKALKVPTAIPVLSWDNLTTKGLFHVLPDLLLVWNAAQVREAGDIHGMPQDRTVITGSPFFDKWFGGRSLSDRSAFLSRLGLEPQKPVIAYLGSSSNIAANETGLIKAWLAAMRTHADERLRTLQVIVRPHPANAAVYRQLEAPGLVVWPREGCLPEESDSEQQFMDTVGHAVSTLGINTSGMIDAIILDKPCIALLAPEYRATQTQTLHFKHLLEADVVEQASGIEQTLACIRRLLDGQDTRAANRRRFVETYIRPCGLNRAAGQAAAQAIESLTGARSPVAAPAEFEQVTVPA